VGSPAKQVRLNKNSFKQEKGESMKRLKILFLKRFSTVLAVLLALAVSTDTWGAISEPPSYGMTPSQLHDLQRVSLPKETHITLTNELKKHLGQKFTKDSEFLVSFRCPASVNDRRLCRVYSVENLAPSPGGGAGK
jgi:hypothetical protein